MEQILDDIRDTVGKTVERKHLISKQDIHNIRRQFNIDGIQDTQMIIPVYIGLC